MRKRRAFGAQDVLETTISNYYLEMSPPQVIDYNSTASASKNYNVENDTKPRAKISFSIESILK